MTEIKIGTRKSLLALTQTEIAAEKIKSRFENVNVTLEKISTKGDERLDRELKSFGGKGVFTRELEDRLLSKEIAMAVHSAKDMPTRLDEGLRLAAAVERADISEVFVTLTGTKLKDMPEGSVIGTGSLRREIQIKGINPHVQIKSIRGNVQTRINKLKEGGYDGIILAKAGLDRLMALPQSVKDEWGLDEVFDGIKTEVLSPEVFMPAPCQGILAVETADSTYDEIPEIFEGLNDTDSWHMLLAERGFLMGAEAGCNAPAAAYSYVENGRLTLNAMFAREEIYKCRATVLRENGEKLGLAIGKAAKNVFKKGKVYLLGGGPFDGMMTVKAMEIIRKADVIVYDDLSSLSALNECREDAELIYVGKRRGKHSAAQQEINDVLTLKAFEKGTVARLKGGDPFVFGRGGEECISLDENGIEYEVISGVTSAVAVPAKAGIPVTHRGSAPSFHVITGHEAEDKEGGKLDYEALAKLPGTLIFLMGLKNMGDICRKLIECGMDKDTPAAAVSKGGRAGQKTVRATLSTLKDKAEQEGLETPAIWLLGDVTRFDFSDKKKLPLSGRSVLITASKELTDEIGDKIELLGGEAVRLSLIKTVKVRKGESDIFSHLTEFSHMVFTSQTGVELFFDELIHRKIDIRWLSGVHFAAIGEKTRAALEKRGITDCFVPKKFSSKHMAEEYPEILTKDDNVLIIRAENGSDALKNALDSRNIPCHVSELYRTETDMRKEDILLRAMDICDSALFCSGSAAKAFAAMGGMDFKGKIYCIGPETEKIAKITGLDIYKTAKEYTADGLIACLSEKE